MANSAQVDRPLPAPPSPTSTHSEMPMPPNERLWTSIGQPRALLVRPHQAIAMRLALPPAAVVLIEVETSSSNQSRM